MIRQPATTRTIQSLKWKLRKDAEGVISEAVTRLDRELKQQSRREFRSAKSEPVEFFGRASE